MRDTMTDAAKLAQKDRKAACDLIIERAGEMMVEEMGAPIEMMIDRMLTFAGAHMCLLDGSQKTAEVFRALATNVENGVFEPVLQENRRGKH